jgi:TonB family protein
LYIRRKSINAAAGERTFANAKCQADFTKAPIPSRPMNPRYLSAIPLLTLWLAGCAHPGDYANSVSSLAGVYSSAHPIEINGVRTLTNGYIEIDRDGRMSAFEQDAEGADSDGGTCFRLAVGTETNAGLQSRILTRGVSPRGDPVYQTRAGDNDTFGILIEPAASGNIQWFFHSGSKNSTVTVNGSRNVVNSTKQSSYSISGPALATPTPAQLRDMLCHSDALDSQPVKPHFAFHAERPKAGATHAGEDVAAAASNPAVTSSAPQPPLPKSNLNSSSLSAALPFEIGKPIDTTVFARLGISPDSPKAKILMDWGKELASDPDINAHFSTTNTDPSTAGKLALARALDLLDGMQRISQQDREQLMGLSARALDNAPPDCGGARNLQEITSRYLSLGTENDDELRAQLRAIFDLFKQSTQNSSPVQITAAQRLQAQLALSASIADALKRNPSEGNDLDLLMSGRQMELSPAAWCNAMRFYHNALNKTPQPARDWIILTGIEDQKRVASGLITLLKNINSATPDSRRFTTEPTVFDYAEMVRQRVRPHIVWSGKVVHGETLVEVHCASSGALESAKIVRSSGDVDWDRAALRAVLKADPMPQDENGEARRSFTITLRPDI